jgi:thiamine pyrophosphate-dependent acetolactate synthase large subunit-like protein
MQYGPGAENAFPGIATAYSDSVPLLLLPLGHPRDRAQVFPLFSSARTYASVTKSVETITLAEQTPEVLRRAFSGLKMGRPGPVMVEVPADVAMEDIDAAQLVYEPVPATCAAGNSQDIEAAARVLVQAQHPVIHAGQGVLYAEAWDELVELAELLQAPVMTTLEGKSAFPEDHPLSLGTGGAVMSGPVYHFLRQADVVFGIGCSFTKHGMSTNIPAGKTIIHATSDARDLHKNYATMHPILGDARLVLRQCIDAVKDLTQGKRAMPSASNDQKTSPRHCNAPAKPRRRDRRHCWSSSPARKSAFPIAADCSLHGVTTPYCCGANPPLPPLLKGGQRGDFVSGAATRKPGAQDILENGATVTHAPGLTTTYENSGALCSRVSNAPRRRETRHRL